MPDGTHIDYNFLSLVFSSCSWRDLFRLFLGILISACSGLVLPLLILSYDLLIRSTSRKYEIFENDVTYNATEFPPDQVTEKIPLNYLCLIASLSLGIIAGYTKEETSMLSGVKITHKIWAHNLNCTDRSTLHYSATSLSDDFRACLKHVSSALSSICDIVACIAAVIGCISMESFVFFESAATSAIFTILQIIVFTMVVYLRASEASSRQVKYSMADKVVRPSLENLASVKQFLAETWLIHKYSTILTHIEKFSILRTSLLAICISILCFANMMHLLPAYVLETIQGSSFIGENLPVLWLSTLTLLAINRGYYCTFTYIKSSELVLFIIQRIPIIPNISERDLTISYMEGELTLNNITTYQQNPNKRALLANLNLHLNDGELILVESLENEVLNTIISILRKENLPKSGSVSFGEHLLEEFNKKCIEKQICYVSIKNIQDNHSIWRNIAGDDETITHKEVQELATMVSADPFILSLPQGYETRMRALEQDGINLDLKMRILLARALRTNPNLLIIDGRDCASLSRKGLFQTALSNLKFGRKILVVGIFGTIYTDTDRINIIKNGTVSEEGTHVQLLTNAADYFEIYQKYRSFRNDSYLSTDIFTIDSDSINIKSFIFRIICSFKFCTLNPQACIWYVFIILALILSAFYITSVAFFGLAFIMQALITSPSILDAGPNETEIVQLCICLGVYALVSCFIHFLSVFFSSIAFEKLLTHLRTKIFRKLINIESIPHDLTVNEISDSLYYDTDIIKRRSFLLFKFFMEMSIGFLIMVIFVSIKCWEISVIIVFITPILMATFLLRAKCRALLEKISNDSFKVALNSILDKSWENCTSIEVSQEERTACRLHGFFSGCYYGTIIFSVISLMYTALWLYTYHFITDTTIVNLTSLFVLVICGLILLSILLPMESDLRSTSINLSLFKLIRLMNIENKQPPLLLPKRRISASFKKASSMSFNSVSYDLPNQRDDIKLIDSLSFEVNTNSKVGVLYKSVAAKNAFIDMLHNSVQPSEGTIKIGGSVVSMLPRGLLMQSIGVLSNSIFIKSATVAENIIFCVDEDTHEVELMNAVKEACLEDWIAELEYGYSTLLENIEEDLNLPIRMQLSITRLLLRDPPVVIIDEIPNISSFPQNDFDNLQKALDNLMHDRACIFMSENEDYLTSCDQIVQIL